MPKKPCEAIQNRTDPLSAPSQLFPHLPQPTGLGCTSYTYVLMFVENELNIWILANLTDRSLSFTIQNLLLDPSTDHQNIWKQHGHVVCSCSGCHCNRAWEMRGFFMSVLRSSLCHDLSIAACPEPCFLVFSFFPITPETVILCYLSLSLQVCWLCCRRSAKLIATQLADLLPIRPVVYLPHLFQCSLEDHCIACKFASSLTQHTMLWSSQPCFTGHSFCQLDIQPCFLLFPFQLMLSVSSQAQAAKLVIQLHSPPSFHSQCKLFPPAACSPLPPSANTFISPQPFTPEQRQ